MGCHGGWNGRTLKGYFARAVSIPRVASELMQQIGKSSLKRRIYLHYMIRPKCENHARQRWLGSNASHFKMDVLPDGWCDRSVAIHVANPFPTTSRNSAGSTNQSLAAISTAWIARKGRSCLREVASQHRYMACHMARAAIYFDTWQHITPHPLDQPRASDGTTVLRRSRCRLNFGSLSLCARCSSAVKVKASS